MYTVTPTLSEATRATRRQRIARKGETVNREAFRAAKARVLAEAAAWEAKRQAKMWEALRSQAFSVPAGAFGKAA